MPLDLKQNHFALFGLPARFALDLGALGKTYRELQSRVHPDKFANAPGAEQRLSMQWAMRVNEAYQTLKSPLRRAHYLLELEGVDPQLETNTAMPGEFLAGQMELREALEDAAHAGDSQRLERLAVQLRRDRDALLGKIESQLDAREWRPAAVTLRQLMFLDKFCDELSAAEERLET